MKYPLHARHYANCLGQKVSKMLTYSSQTSRVVSKRKTRLLYFNHWSAGNRGACHAKELFSENVSQMNKVACICRYGTYGYEGVMYFQFFFFFLHSLTPVCCTCLYNLFHFQECLISHLHHLLPGIWLVHKFLTPGTPLSAFSRCFCGLPSSLPASL